MERPSVLLKGLILPKFLIGFVKSVAQAGSIVETDGLGGYNDLPMRGYEHVKRILSKNQDPDPEPRSDSGVGWMALSAFFLLFYPIRLCPLKLIEAAHTCDPQHASYDDPKRI